MRVASEPRRNGYGGVVFGLVVATLVGYLGFAALQGEHGLLSLFQVEAQEHHLQAELKQLRLARDDIANKTERLSTGSLDVELLDEQARKVLGLGGADELLIR